MIKNLLVAGDSQSAGFNESGNFVKSYGQWISEYRNFNLTNLSDPGVDNQYIKRKLFFNLDKFYSKNTLIIFHIAPYTRKCFWFDDSRPIDKNNHIWFKSFEDQHSNIGWFRSNGKNTRIKGTKTKFNPLEFKDNFGNDFFDNYYHTYFTLQESYLETLETLLSVQDRLSLLNYKFLFVLNNKHLFNDTIKHKDEFNFILKNLDFSKFFYSGDKFGFDDFIINNGFTASKDDYHANAQGHKEFSLLLNEKISSII